MRITMNHGAGGEVMGQLIHGSILKNITQGDAGGVTLSELDDGGSFPLGDHEVVISADAHIVSPIFFPGGDIGKLAVCGTANDLAVMGARPHVMADTLIIEEGFEVDDLDKILRSMNHEAENLGVSIIAGDTKVAERGAVDGIAVTTVGIGLAKKGEVVRDCGIKVGDRIIVTGTLGDHGMALMAHREGIGFETSLTSDVASIWHMVEKALDIGGVSAMKDPTRGGLSGVLNDWVVKNDLGIIIHEDQVPLKEEVKAVSGMLGLDPFTVACEGKAVMAVRGDKAEAVLDALRSTGIGRNAMIIGEAAPDYPGKVILDTAVGGKRIMEAPIGDPVPRVC